MVAVCRYGEIFLKGKNKKWFEQVLIRNVKLFMRKNGINESVKSTQNRVFIDTSESCLFLRCVFGLVSFSPTIKIPLDLAQISEVGIKLLNKKPFSSFKVAAQRVTKNSKLSSIDVNVEVGTALVKHFKKKVNLTNPDVSLGVEIIGDNAYVFVDSYRGVGGLPVGVSGKVFVLMDVAFSELTTLLMMKRGCDVIGIGLDDLKSEILSNFSPNSFCFKKIQSLDEITEITRWFGAQALVIGSFDAQKDIILNSEFGIPVLNPLIGMSEREAEEKLRSYESLC